MCPCRWIHQWTEWMEILGLQGAYLPLGGNRHVRINLVSDAQRTRSHKSQSRGLARGGALAGVWLFSSLKAASSLGFSSQQRSPCPPLAPVLSSDFAGLYQWLRVWSPPPMSMARGWLAGSCLQGQTATDHTPVWHSLFLWDSFFQHPSPLWSGVLKRQNVCFSPS